MTSRQTGHVALTFVTSHHPRASWAGGEQAAVVVVAAVAVEDVQGAGAATEVRDGERCELGVGVH
jgi:hypothetical protein